MTETHRYLLAFLATTLYVLWVAVLYYKHKKVHDRTLAHSLTTPHSLIRHSPVPKNQTQIKPVRLMPSTYLHEGD